MKYRKYLTDVFSVDAGDDVTFYWRLMMSKLS